MNEMRRPLLKLMIIITDREKSNDILEVLERENLHLLFQCRGEGTAKSELLDVLGLGRSEKILTLSLVPEFASEKILPILSHEFQLFKQGKGIAFTAPISGVNNPIFKLLSEEAKEKLFSHMESEVEKMKSDATYHLILAIINQGYSEELIESAKTAGATGGTVIHARRVGDEPLKLWGITVQEEKEIVLILAAKEQKIDIMKVLSHDCGLKTDAQGLIFSLPVDNVVGLFENQQN